MRKKLQHDSFPPTTIICFAQAPLIDHPAKAQAVAAELEVLHEFTERALENVENAFGFLQ